MRKRDRGKEIKVVGMGDREIGSRSRKEGKIVYTEEGEEKRVTRK